VSEQSVDVQDQLAHAGILHLTSFHVFRLFQKSWLEENLKLR